MKYWKIERFRLSWSGLVKTSGVPRQTGKTLSGAATAYRALAIYALFEGSINQDNSVVDDHYLVDRVLFNSDL